MKKFLAVIDLSATLDLWIEAENSDEAMSKAMDMVQDEDKLIAENRDKIVIWSPVIDYVEEGACEDE